MPSYAHSLDVRDMSPPRNQATYMNKPLPAPPVSKVRSRSSSQGSSRAGSRVKMFPAIVGSLGTSVDDLPSIVLPHRPLSRGSGRSLPGSPVADRRTSMRASQIIGTNVGICFDWTPARGFSNYASPVLIGDDSSSNYSLSLDEPIYEEDEAQCPGCDVPTLIADECDGTDSKRNSEGPISPTGPSEDSARIYSYISDQVPDSIPTSPIVDDEASSGKDSPNNYFSDAETADEYHRFTVNLAKVDKKRGRKSSPALTPIMRSHSLTSRFSVSARSLFSRRRDPPRSVCADHGDVDDGGDSQAHSHSHSHGPSSSLTLQPPQPHSHSQPHSQPNPPIHPQVHAHSLTHNHRRPIHKFADAPAHAYGLSHGPSHSPAPSIARRPQSENSSTSSPILSGPADGTVSPPNQSVFEYSEDEVSDDEDTHVREAIKDFFGPSRHGEGHKTVHKKTHHRKSTAAPQINIIPE